MVEILKIERIGSNGWYTVYEKELLTEEERELLKVMIKNLCADIGYIKKSDEKVILIKNNGIEIAQIVIKDIILGFKNLVKNKEYTLSELRIGEIEMNFFKRKNKDNINIVVADDNKELPDVRKISVPDLKQYIIDGYEEIRKVKNEKEKYERWIYIQEYDGKIHTQDDIVSIATKEQFENIKYKVGE